MISMFSKKYTLTKSRRILKRGVRLYKNKSTRLSSSQYTEFETHLKLLDDALLKKNRTEADRLARLIESFCNHHFPKTFFESAKELVAALVFAIIVAFCIRHFWFELYEVPTGSMRPTILEQDRLVVSKTTFGINIPFTNTLWLFKPENIQRGSIIVFTTTDMDIPDNNMRYFYLFPGKKRFIKRCVAKGGDTIYFYGGRIYVLDSEDKPILELADSQWLEKNDIASIDHIPVITFEGKIAAAMTLKPHVFGETTIRQMNLLVGRLQVNNDVIEGQFFDGSNWVKENVNELKQSHNKPVTYGDLWGINNYAMTRLLSSKEAKQFYPQLVKEQAVAYLELRHTPTLTFPQPILRQSESFVIQPMLTPFKALLPLTDNHLQLLMEGMTTARFVVQNERAYRYNEGKKRSQPLQFDPSLPHVADGTYEFYKGKAYEIHFGGIRTELDKGHSLYSQALLPTLFNMGVSFNTLYQPTQVDQPFLPQRFAFYRDGDFFVMDTLLFTKKEIQPFVEKEVTKQNNSSSAEPYIAFVDRGAPLKDGQLDVAFLKAFGLKVPANHVVALGDNYASSADSRDFGFVPVHNLRGGPLFTFWPPGKRLGPLPQPAYPWLTPANIVVGLLVTTISIITILYIRKRNRTSFFKE